MLALLSDLHANLHALHACLAHAREAGATRFAVLGDLVGYGAHPAEVLEDVMALAEAGAIVLRGNHDEAALAPRPRVVTQQDRSAAWTHERLPPGQLAFLAELPLVASLQSDMFVHASADAPETWTYVDQSLAAQRCLAAAQAEAPAIRRVFCGHVHHQRLFFRGRSQRLLAFEPLPGAPVPMPDNRDWVITVGSVGQPRDGDPRAMYTLYDPEAHRLTFQRVSYDHLAAAAAIRRAGLPTDFADRLELGR